jgi:tRNA A37 methylthiotransferase MiaB
MRAQQEIVLARNRAMKGKTLDVVIEEPAAGGREGWIARSRTQAPDVDSVTYVTGENLRPGRFLRVVVSGSSGYDLLAKCKVQNAKCKITTAG